MDEAGLCRGVRQLDCAARVQSMLEDRGLRPGPGALEAALGAFRAR
jgi:hypothetical protein